MMASKFSTEHANGLKSCFSPALGVHQAHAKPCAHHQSMSWRRAIHLMRVDQARSSEKLRANNDSNDGDSTGDSDDDGSRGGSGGDSNKLRLEPRCRLRLR